MPGARKSEPLVRTIDLCKTYSRGHWWEKQFQVRALDGVDLILERGKTLAIVGESGSGKSTLAMCVALLDKPDSGEIRLEGRDVLSLPRSEMALLRPRVQMVFQESASALSAHFSATEIIEEPLVIQRRYSPAERSELVCDLMARVGLPPSWKDRRPHQFSSGQRQRLAIARALVLQPSLLILDEPFTGLDLSTQGRLVNLLLELQAERSLAYLYISHDLDLVEHFSDDVIALDHGKVVTRGLSRTPFKDEEPARTQIAAKSGGNVVSHTSPSRVQTRSQWGTAVRDSTRYLSFRLLQAIFLLFGVSLLSFVFLELAPGDFFEEMRLNPQISQETVSRLRAEYGMDRTLPIRYGSWLVSVARGNFGYSFAYGSPVAPLLWARARNTLLLAGSALLLAWLTALTLGVFAAEFPGSLLDRACALGTSVLLAVPELLVGLCFLALAVRTGWFHVGGMVSPGFEEFGAWERIGDVAAHLVLPVVVLVLCSLPLLLRHVRSAISGVIDSPFIRSARGHGIGRGRILFRHALPAAINPLVSLFGFSLASLLSVSLVTEIIMSWPGLGPLLLEAVMEHDVYVVVGAVTFSTMLLVGATTLTDILLYAADPRIRTESLG
jgi:peptide/nickel transport system permease protein